MDNLIFLPDTESLANAIDVICDTNKTSGKNNKIDAFKVLAKQVIQHSDEIKIMLNSNVVFY